MSWIGWTATLRDHGDGHLLRGGGQLHRKGRGLGDGVAPGVDEVGVRAGLALGGNGQVQAERHLLGNAHVLAHQPAHLGGGLEAGARLGIGWHRQFDQQRRPAAPVRNDIAASDLRFSGRTWLVLYSFLDTHKIVNKPWTKGLMIHFTIENLLNDRIKVTDRNGQTPNRFQPALIDPVGRSIRIGVRKLF